MKTEVQVSVQEVFETVEKQAEKAQPAILSYDPPLKVGEWCQQGDIYLRKIEPERASLGVRRQAQLVDGTTVGARHVASAPAEVYEVDPRYTPRSLRGVIPMVSAFLVVNEKGTTIRHPEHAHHFLTEGTYEVIRQMDMTTKRAVID